MKRALVFLSLVLGYQYTQAQCMLVPVSLENRTAHSDLIIEGKITSQYSFWNADHNMIYTTNFIEVYKVFKGSISTTSVQVLTLGGTVGLDKIVAEPSLSLSINDIGIFTCENVKRYSLTGVDLSGIPVFEVYASNQGFIKYDLEKHTASDPFNVYTNIQSELYPLLLSPLFSTWQTIVPFDPGSNNNSEEEEDYSRVITSISPTTVTAGTGTTITITGTGFGATQGSGSVRFRNADDGGATFITPLPSQYISWSSTQIVVQVPQNAGTGVVQVVQGVTQTSASTLTVTYAHTNVDFDPGPGTIAYQTDHVDDNGSGGYTWRMNTNFDANTAAKESFLRAFDTWRCNTGVKWTMGATTSINDAVSDGTNIICFDNSAPLSTGVLGVCYSYWSGCASGPTIIWYVNELDIIFDDGSNILPLTWQFGPAVASGSEFDFESVAVHELGHGHQLQHVIAPGAILHYALGNGTTNRIPNANDLAGANFVQSKSIVPNVCGPGAMTNYLCIPTTGFSAAPTTVCSGDTIFFTDMSTNTPFAWSWSFPGGTPSSSTNQNPTVVYNTAGVYDVSLTATNSGGSDVHTLIGYITVLPTPSVGYFLGPNDTICAGNTIILDGTGANTYAWSGGVINGIFFAPPASGTYTVTGTDLNGCTNTNSASIVVNPLPTVNFLVNPNDTICAGTPIYMNGTGAASYSWSGGVIDGQPFISPSSDSYSLIGTDTNGCNNNTTAFIVVNPSPTVGLFVNPNDTVCSGSAIDLNGTGADSYVWSGGVTDGQVFVPPASDTYILVGTDTNGCTDTNSINIVVNPLPTVNLGADVVQPSPPAVLNAGAGFSSYLWSTSEGTPTISVNINGSYSVIVSDTNGCFNSDTIEVAFTASVFNGENSHASLQVYPNPCKDIVYMVIQNLESENVQMKLTDVTGKIVRVYTPVKVHGSINLPLNIEGLSYGVYVLAVESAALKKQIRLVVEN